MGLELTIGLDAVNSYKRLAYTAWHALAEFVDNSTQSYFNNKQVLDSVFQKSSDCLEVGIVYQKEDGGFLRVADNAMGMSYEELEHALHIGLPPKDTSGRSKYGMGLKTSASWIGNEWTVRTKKLGETVEHQVTVDIDEIVGNYGKELPYRSTDDLDANEHYTIIEIRRHNRTFHGRTLGKIKDFLKSMYREDFRRGQLRLKWQHEILEWQDFEMLKDREGNEYKKNVSFEVSGAEVSGWVGILAKGTRANAGFSVIHCGRVVRGWPEAWRPSTLYGQLQGSNDLVNQRLVGEIHLDAFDVSHTKDDILWLGDEEERVEKELAKHCSDYREAAKAYRRKQDDERGPTEEEYDVALDEFREELMSPEMLDRLTLDEAIPPEQAVKKSVERLTRNVEDKKSTFEATHGGVRVKGYIESDMSTNDPYLAVDSAEEDKVIILINRGHPHWQQLKGSEGVLNYLRHCTYDGIAEWQSRQRMGRVDPDTIKVLKDRLLRVPLEIELHANSESE